VGLTSTGSPDALDHFPTNRFALVVFMPIWQYVLLKSAAVIGDPIFVEDDLAIAGIHCAIAANSAC